MEKSLITKYENWNKENTPTIHLNNEKHIAKCISVYDGDSATVALFLNKQDERPFQFKIRLIGYDSPEIRTKDKEEKQAALECKEILSKLILNKVVYVEFAKEDDKWGRCLAKIYIAKSIATPQSPPATANPTNEIPCTCHCVDDKDSLKPDLLCVNDYMINNTRSYKYDGKTKKEFGKDY